MYLIKDLKIYNENPNSNNYLICPSGNCLNIPQISYEYNFINSSISYKCKCQNNAEKILKPEEFLENISKIVCNNCKKIINEETFYYCYNCNNKFDISCGKFHSEISMHLNMVNIDKNNLNNENNKCKEHKSQIIFQCKNCNESLCEQCDFNSHGEKGHILTQLKNYSLNQKDLDIIKSNFEKQKKIFIKIKEINNNLIKSLENDIEIKQKIINNYDNNTMNYNSISNLKNLYVQNNKKYENLLNTIIDSKEEKDNNEKNLEIYLDKILSLLYYTLMINKNQNNNNNIINNIENKIINLKSNKYNIDVNELSDKSLEIENKPNKNINISNINLMKNNMPELLDNKNDDIFSNKNTNPQFSLFSNFNLLNNSLPNMNQIINDKYIENSENIININESQKEQDKEDKEIKKKRSLKGNVVNNLIKLKSGNFALSIKQRIEIYNLKKINFSKGKNVICDKLIKKNCLIQKISLYTENKGKFISNIFEFSEGLLLCSIYSKIIVIKLTYYDYHHECITSINLDNIELARKLISLGDSLLAVLSEQNKDCAIKIYQKKDVIPKKNIIENEIKNKEPFNPFIIPFKNLENNDELMIRNNQDGNLNFELIVKNFNIYNIFYTSISEIKKNSDINNEKIKIEVDNYLYEFIAVSNSCYSSGKDKITFYGIKKDLFDKYEVKLIDEIYNISCSIEYDSICQLNEKFLCVGLQRYNYGQRNGLALIDITKRQIYKIIDDHPNTSLFYDDEKKLLLASSISKKKIFHYTTKIYQVVNDKGNENEGNDNIELKNIYTHENKFEEKIISIRNINSVNEQVDNVIFVASSKDSNLEAVNVKIQN